MSAAPDQDRVFRVVVCRACRWQYGAWWYKSIEVSWGDCPRCGAPTTVETAFLPERRAVPDVPGQQELVL